MKNNMKLYYLRRAFYDIVISLDNMQEYRDYTLLAVFPAWPTTTGCPQQYFVFSFEIT